MFSFFKVQQKGLKKTFNYQPRYFDPKKEEREERMQGGTAQRLRKQWRKERRAKQQVRNKARSRSNLRMLLIFALLLWLAYYLLKYPFEGFVEFFMPATEQPVEELPQWGK